MNLNKILYKKSAYYFVSFFLFTIWAFWPTYYSRLLSEMPAHIHFHGITMTIWCLIIISQALLIRFKKFKLHKAIGRFSYIIVPIIFISGFNTAHSFLKGAELSTDNYYSSIALMFNSLIIFVILYGLAIYYVKKPLVHARYMLCTLFPIFTPLTDRLIYNNADSMLSFLPTLDGSPMVWLIGFAIVDLMLICLVIWDWRFQKRTNVFPVVLGLLLLYHISVIYFYKFSFWRSFGDWIMSFPLS